MGKVSGKSAALKPASKKLSSKFLDEDLSDALDLFSTASNTSEQVLEGSELENTTLEEISEAAQGPKIYSVSEISSDLRDTLRENFSDILIQGEIADFKGVHRSGHLYFALKDDSAAIKAVMWRASAAKVPFELKQGLEVIVTGKLDYYAGTGSLQIVIDKMEPVGMGALQLKLEQLKEKLKAEGLFAAERKRKISPLNWRIGVVTSKTTAAFQDMLKIFRTRFPLAEIFFFQASVQGEKAPSELIQAIDRANRFSGQALRPLDVLIIARGGGSYEDLFCFNDEALARAIVASKIPTVSAVGHEIDFTIADFVADKRAATPSHAASEVVPDQRLWFERLEEISRNFAMRMGDAIFDYRQKLDTLYNRLIAASPAKKIEQGLEALRMRRQRIESLMKWALEKRKNQIARLAGVMDALSPLKVLDRGYSLASQEKNGKVVKSVQDVQKGDRVSIRLSDGSVLTEVL